jgi:hypothetical protein
MIKGRKVPTRDKIIQLRYDAATGNISQGLLSTHPLSHTLASTSTAFFLFCLVSIRTTHGLQRKMVNMCLPIDLFRGIVSQDEYLKGL